MRLLSLSLTIAILASCNDTAMKPKKTYTPEEITANSKKLNEWFDKVWDESIDRSPVAQTYYGIKKDYGSWGDFSDSFAIKEHQITMANLDSLKQHFDPEGLDEVTRTSYRMWVEDAEQQKEGFEFMYHNYPFDHMNGAHNFLISFLINVHLVTDKKDAEAYVSRLQKLKPAMDQLIEGQKTREAKGIIMPKWGFPMVIADCKGIISGAPFDDSKEPSPIFADLQTKVNALENVSAEEKKALIAAGKTALQQSVQPAYEELIAYLTELEKKATNDDGVWKLPNGGKFYNYMLRSMTTTDMSAEEIYETGQKEVARIQGEMKAIMKQVGFKSDSLQDFFQFMKTDPQFYYPNTDAGRKKYFAESEAVIDTMRAKLDDLFGIKPKAKLVVKRVEEFREKTAGSAFYESPAPDGSRPGTYYIGMYDMKGNPSYEIEALCYHEAIPGHHMQISIAQELDSLPKFRTLGGDYTAYVEGWGLYCEYIPKEYGFYKDPYSDFGRLSMELFRACRLVADVGIHYKKWTRQQALDYYLSNTPSPRLECESMVDRHIVMPGQATAYKVGQLKLLQLLKKSREQLGDKFDIRQFHDVVLGSGAVPLSILEENVQAWIERKKGA
ncbi:MAG: DUF885 domain-containing protein [Chitinophagales bacterium]|nr:DUF885 domain-containing protein [Chitinophagales bacterium]